MSQPSSGHVFTSLVAGVASVANINDEELGIRTIEITVLNPANDVHVTITKLDGQPAEITQEITGAVERYMEITATNLESEDIDVARVRFTVPKSWIADNNIDRSTIRLHRHADGWQALDTRPIGEDEDHYVFVADTPGFSTFAVAGEEETPPRQPSINVRTQPAGDTITVESLYLDQPGFVVVHADADGSPGEVIGNSELLEGEVTNLVVSIDETLAGSRVHAMLHYDDGDGVYTSLDEDIPVRAEGSVVNQPVTLQAEEESAVPEEQEERGLPLMLLGLLVLIAVVVYWKWDQIIKSIRGKRKK